MQLVRRLWSNIAYLLLPAAGAFSPLLVIPAVTHAQGSAGWTAMAIGQSIGGAAAVVGELGWGVTGPQVVPRLSAHARISIFRASLSSRLVASVPLGALAAVVAACIVQSGRFDAALIALGTALTALSPIWFYIGINKAPLILKYESIPKLLTAFISAVFIFCGIGSWIFGLLTALQVLTTTVLTLGFLGTPMRPLRTDFVGVRAIIRDQAVIAAGRSVSVAYTYLPTTILGAVAPGAVAVFAASDRLSRMLLSVLASVPSRMQSWLGSSDKVSIELRRSQALLMNALLGVIAGTGFVALAPVISGYIFSKQVHLNLETTLLAAGIIAVICASRGAGLVLVSYGAANLITGAIIPSALVALSLLAPLSLAYGSSGALGAGLVAELTGLLFQLGMLAMRKKGISRAPIGRHDVVVSIDWVHSKQSVRTERPAADSRTAGSQRSVSSVLGR